MAKNVDELKQANNESATATSELASFDREIEQYSLQGHWKMELPANMAPRSRLQPMHWKWSLIRDRLMRAGQLIGVNEAGRRTIQLLNPGLLPLKSTTHTLQMSIQLVLPGEIAAAHRHTMAAIRFVIEGGGTFTTVEGSSFLMEPGDLILTPNWTWHDHINESGAPIIWIDGLDVPFTRAMDVMFIEEYSQPRQAVKRVLKTSEDSIVTEKGSPWYFKWRDAERTLWQRLERSPENDGGPIMQYQSRAGGPTLPTIACYAQLLRSRQRTKARRETSSGIYHVISGRGKTVIGNIVYEWEKGDFFVVPNWSWYWHENNSPADDAFLFFMSDRPLLEPFGLYREEYGR